MLLEVAGWPSLARRGSRPVGDYPSLALDVLDREAALLQKPAHVAVKPGGALHASCFSSHVDVCRCKQHLCGCSPSQKTPFASALTHPDIPCPHVPFLSLSQFWGRLELSDLNLKL